MCSTFSSTSISRSPDHTSQSHKETQSTKSSASPGRPKTRSVLFRESYQNRRREVYRLKVIQRSEARSVLSRESYQQRNHRKGISIKSGRLASPTHGLQAAIAVSSSEESKARLSQGGLRRITPRSRIGVSAYVSLSLTVLVFVSEEQTCYTPSITYLLPRGT